MDAPPNEETGIRRDPPPHVETGITAAQPQASDKQAVQQGVRRRIFLISLLSCCMVPLAGCGVISFVGYTCFNPTDRVRVTLTGLSGDVDLTLVASESGGSTHFMPLYLAGVFPFVSSEKFIQPFRPIGGEVSYNIAWQPGDSYIVFTRDNDRKWLATKFTAGETAIQGRLPVLGEGRVTFDLSKGQTEMLSEEKVKELGLDKAR